MQKKIFIIFVALVLVGVITTGVLALGLLRVNYLDSVEERLINNANLIKEFLYSYNYESLDLNNLAMIYSNQTDTRVSFIDKEGNIVGDSSSDLVKFENHRNRFEIIKAFEGQVGINQRYSESLKKDMIYVAVPFNKDNSTLSVIRVSVPIETIMDTNTTFLKYSIISMLAGSIVALLLGFRYVKGTTDPIRQLTIATKKIANGNFGNKIYSRTGDELGELSENFNIMSVRLKETIEELQESNTKTKAILTSMVDGVIALDNYNNVILVNPSAQEIFGIKESEIIGNHLSKIVNDNIIDDLLDSLFNGIRVSKSEIEVFKPNHRILSINSSNIRLNHDPNRTLGKVIIIRDITEIRKLENMRKEFVANVSHELKTPLTSIKGFVETLKEGAADNKKVRDKFLDIIDIEANRLTLLIQDLLLLSEIENKNSLVTKEFIYVNKLINEIIEFMVVISSQKDIEIVNKINNNLPIIQGNSGWFKQMLINIIDNGIKYTPNGGKITITAYSISEKLYVKVSDTGIGIEKDHLSRLFERFYRVDRARSRQVGGTGLGLAIAKHIVISFKGNIDVKSEIGKGTEFLITLPIN